VIFGNPTEEQVQQFQNGLNTLQGVKGEQDHPLQQMSALNASQSQIQTVRNAGSFRRADRQLY
jgi:hypothetical protein